MNVNRHFHPLRWLLIVTLICGSTLALAGCQPGGSTPAPQPQPPSGGNQPPAPAAEPDLTISAIEGFPSQPASGQKFAVNVYVTNAGGAVSGDFDLALSIRYVGRGSTYPIGTFRSGPLHPGENVPVYTSNDRLVNDPGSFQVHAEITPFNFQDGNSGNNTSTWAFTVK